MGVRNEQLFIKQGLAWQNLLRKTDLKGSHQQKIADIEREIKKARQKSAKAKSRS